MVGGTRLLPGFPTTTPRAGLAPLPAVPPLRHPAHHLGPHRLDRLVLVEVGYGPVSPGRVVPPLRVVLGLTSAQVTLDLFVVCEPGICRCASDATPAAWPGHG